MATKKPVKAAKPAAKATKPAKKAVAPAKKPVAAKAKKPVAPAKPVAKKAAPVAKKPAAKPAKALAKPVKKAAVKPVAAKKAVAVNKKPAVKAAPAKKPVAKPVAKKIVSSVKKTEKKSAKEIVPKKKVTVVKISGSYKKADVKRPVVKEVVVKETGPKKLIVVPSKPSVNAKPEPKKVDKPRSNKPVVIPKTSTNAKVEYKPDFTQSVLDKPAKVASKGPTMRYSDNDLQEFRDLINKKLDAAKKELAYLQGLITRRDEMGGDETDNKYMTMEDGGMSMEREQLSQMASRQITFIDHLEKAIMRIENKTYGICRVSGNLIDKARLRAVPHATLSMEAKLGIVK